MADSLRLKGCKSISKRTGDGLLLRRPKRGGDIFKVPTWWNLKHTTQYVSAAIFKVTSSKGELALVVPVDPETTDIIIKHDGDGNFTFPSVNGVDRVAVMAADLGTFYEEYQFSKISGGPVLKRTVNAIPDAPVPEEPITFTASSTIAGTATVGETLTGTAATYTGGVGSVTTNLVFQVSDDGSTGWSFLSGNPGTASGATATYELQAGDEGKFIRVSYQVTDDNETKSSNSAATSAIGTTFAARVAAATTTYVVTVNEDDKYELNGVEKDDITMSVGESIVFDLSDASLSGHPLGIFTDSAKTTQVTVGVEMQGDQLLFEPPIAGTFSYQCVQHLAMGGDITVS